MSETLYDSRLAYEQETKREWLHSCLMKTPQALIPGWSANRKLSGFHGGISPVKSALLRSTFRFARDTTAIGGKLQMELPASHKPTFGQRR
jgi:hypothetical protein